MRNPKELKEILKEKTESFRESKEFLKEMEKNPTEIKDTLEDSRESSRESSANLDCPEDIFEILKKSEESLRKSLLKHIKTNS